MVVPILGVPFPVLRTLSFFGQDQIIVVSTIFDVMEHFKNKSTFWET